MNVLLIIVDTLRFDILGINGEEHQLTSNLDTFAKNNTNHKNCYSAAPWTLPSCASILTGHYASNHNLMTHYQKLTKQPISTILKGHGYHTVAITNNSNFAPNIGYQNHFDEYYYYPDGNKKIQLGVEVNHETPFKKAIEILGKKEENQFIFLHTNIVHDYYLDSNIEYCGLANATDWDPSANKSLNLQTTLAEYLEAEASDATYSMIYAKYLAGLKYMDSKIGELLSSVDLDNTLVTIVGDHGEGFDYKNNRVHHGGRLHNDVIHVSLLTNSKLKSDQESIKSTVDIVPSILAELGISPKQTFDGIPFNKNHIRRIYSEDYGYLYIPNSLKRISYKSDDIFGTKAAIDSDYKLIKTSLNGEISYEKYSILDIDETNKLDVTEEDKSHIRDMFLSRPYNLENYNELLSKLSVLNDEHNRLLETQNNEKESPHSTFFTKLKAFLRRLLN